MIRKVMLVLMLVLMFVGSTYASASIEDDVDAKRFSVTDNTIVDNFYGIEWTKDKHLIPGWEWSQSGQFAGGQIMEKRKYLVKRKRQQAIDYCENLDLDNKSDWRLPDVQTLAHITELPSVVNSDSNIYFRTNSSKFFHLMGNKYTAYEYEESPNKETGYYSMRNVRIEYYDTYVLCVRGEKTYDKNYYKKQRNLLIKKETNKRAKLEFLKIKNSDNIKINVEFTKKYPISEQTKIIIEKLYQLAKAKNNIVAYEWFIKTYPKASQVKEAIDNIHKLAFAKAKDIDAISAYNTFIISYPMAKEVSQANKLAKELERYKYTDTLPEWVRDIMPNVLADILNSIFGIFSSDEKKSRALLIKAKQIERQGNEYWGDKQAGYMIVVNRMYDLLQEEYDDTDATLRFLESEEFKDFVRTFKSSMRRINDRLDNIARYSSEILEVSKEGFSQSHSDSQMAAYHQEEKTKWDKYMHFIDKGYQ